MRLQCDCQECKLFLGFFLFGCILFPVRESGAFMCLQFGKLVLAVTAGVSEKGISPKRSCVRNGPLHILMPEN